MSHPLASRRQFLQMAANATGAAAILSGVDAHAAGVPQPEAITDPATKRTPTLAEVFKDIPLTDQYGKSFDPTSLFADKPCLIVFGYGGCPLCEEISNSVAASQNKLKNVPVIVISVQPDEDRDRMQDYVSRYYAKGIKQFAEETLPAATAKRIELGKKSYLENRDKPQSERLLHIACPPSAEAAQLLEDRLQLFHNRARSKVHSFDIVVCKNGKASHKQLAINESFEAPPAFAQGVAENVSKLLGLGIAPGR